MDRYETALDSVPSDRFDDLDPARREAVFDAAMQAFGRDGYKRAMTEDIARDAGMSKGLLFFYFHNKRDLYLRLVDYLMDKITDIVVDEGFWEINDYFELMLYAGRKKSAVMQRFPHLLDFCVRAYYPEHRDVRARMNAWTQVQVDAMWQRFFKNVRLDRFRDDVSIRHVNELLIWLADGYLHQVRMRGETLDLDDMLEQMEEWCAVLRSWAYKEEYR